MKSLWLQNNGISDISPLENLTKLKLLHLGGNEIVDISPLLHTTGLFIEMNSFSDQTIILDGNNLSEESISQYIPELKKRGFNVSY